jgi:hypothetical protein
MEPTIEAVGGNEASASATINLTKPDFQLQAAVFAMEGQT